MIILPAIDLKDRNVVRLYRGDFDTTEKVADDPIDTARRFEDAGADWVHVVDLDGALEGHSVNMDIVEKIIKETSLYVEVGGGIRDMETITEYIGIGAKRVILGSAALWDPDLVNRAVSEYDDIIAVGIDADKDMVKVNAWTKESKMNFLDLAQKMDDMGVRTIIYTDIRRDGSLTGPNKENLDRLNQSVDANIIASGGVHNIDDIGTLASIGLYGTICGKSIYTGDVDLVEALELGRNYR